MFSFSRALLIAFWTSMALSACDDPERAANQKYVTAAERIAAAQNSADALERRKLLTDAEALVAVILKDYGGTAAAVRISANEKIGTLTRQELANALRDASGQPENCITEPTYACLKAALDRYVAQAPTALDKLPDPQAEALRATSEQHALMAVGTLRALGEPVADQLQKTKGPKAAEYYLAASSEVGMDRDCELALALYRVHGIERAKTFLRTFSSPQMCSPDGLGTTARWRLDIDDTEALVDILKVHTPAPAPDQLTSMLSALLGIDCAHAQAHVTKILPWWPRDRLAQLLNARSSCEMSSGLVTKIYDMSTSQKDKEAIASWIATFSNAPPIQRYGFMLKSPQHNRWDLNYEWLRRAFANNDAALLTAVATHMRRLPPHTYNPEYGALAQLQLHLANAIIDGAMATRFPQLVSQFLAAQPSITPRHILSYCAELLNIAQSKPELPTDALNDTCIATVAAKITRKDFTDAAYSSEVVRLLVAVSQNRGAPSFKATLQKMPDPLLAYALENSSALYPDMNAALPASTMRRVLSLIVSREQFRIRTYQLLPSIKAGTNEWREEVGRDENVREYVIGRLLNPNPGEDGSWRNAALEEMKRAYPLMVYDMTTGQSSIRLTPEERLRDLRAVMQKHNLPRLHEHESGTLLEIAKNTIRSRNPAALLKLYAEPALTSEDRIWLLGEATILMSAK
ncbi:hypothetical protein [Hyphomicrobium sp. CS1BSMeth3]|uniref:hypothetical protein n=1 Tax=Hyphomicrobium sp. CS1BSMeth3 TaxID=1892844 RepID=UPI000930DEF7|nr:hypothetical protein [Hyphomicrobium sp. CS1BSMeth3]